MTSTALTADTIPSFNELVSAYGKDLQRYALWLAGDRHTAEDLVQETLLRAWKSLDRLQNPKAVKGWLLTILRRENARRFERYQPPQSAIPLEELGSKRKEYDTSTEAFVLRQALDRLPGEYREPLLLQAAGRGSDRISWQVQVQGQSQQAAGRGQRAAGGGNRVAPLSQSPLSSPDE
jgi:RNA polymerase sigma-70 factor (ECF subfamily)